MSFEDNNLSCEISSKMTTHPKDISPSCDQDQKQVPFSWEELWEAESKHSTCDVVNVDKERHITKSAIEKTDKKGRSNAKEDYYTSLQRTVSAELKAAHNFDLSGRQKSVKKNKPRWNRKHQSEIDRDKSLLCLWFKEGIMSNAYAPRCPKGLDSDSDPNDVMTSDEYQPSGVKPITLGDYMPTMCKNKVHCDESDIFERRNDKVSFRANPISENVFDDWDVVDAKEIRLTEQKADYLEEQQRLYYERHGLSVPIWVKPKSDNDSARGDSAESDHYNSASVRQDNATITKVSENCYTKTSDDQKSVCYSSLDDVMHEYLNQHKKKAESRIPLCKHGIRYLAEKFSETLVSEGKVLVEFLPRSQLFAFANELRDLVKEVESLQISLLNNKFLTCQKAYCRWKHIGKYKNQGKRHPQSPLTHHNDLASFRTKVFRVESLEFKLQTILDCEYDPSYLERYSEEALKIRYKKDLDILESNKSKDFSTNIKRFVETVFREVFILMESLPQGDALNLRKSIDEFINATQSMQEREKRIQNPKVARCCNFFRLKRSERENSSSDSDVSPSAETDYTKRSDLTANTLSDITDYTKRSVLSVDCTSSQTDNIEVCDQFTQTGPDQCQTTVKRRSVFPRQCRPTVLDIPSFVPKQLPTPVEVRHMPIIQEAIPDGKPSIDQVTIIEPIVSVEAAVRAAFNILTSIKLVQNDESEIETAVRQAIDKALDKQYALQITSASLNAYDNQKNINPGSVEYKEHETEIMTHDLPEGATSKSDASVETCNPSENLADKNNAEIDEVDTPRRLTKLPDYLTLDGENETSSFLTVPNDEMKCSINVRKRRITFVPDTESLDDVGIPSSSSIQSESDSDSNCELRKTISEQSENYDNVSRKESETENVTQDLEKDLLETTNEINVVFDQNNASIKINEAESEAI